MAVRVIERGEPQGSLDTVCLEAVAGSLGGGVGFYFFEYLDLSTGARQARGW